MKTLDRFGDWIITTGAGNVFMFAVVVLTALTLWDAVFGEIVVLSSKEFECALPVPDGIGSKCVEYHLKRGK
jgi:hypothetical protein